MSGVRTNGERREHLAGRGVHLEHRRHQLLPHDGALVPEHGEALGIDVPSRQDALLRQVGPRAVGDLVRHAYVRPVLPPEEAVRVVEEGRPEQLGLGVLVEGGARVAVREGLLDLHARDVERVVPRVLGVAVAVVAQAEELPQRRLAVAVVVRLDVREAHEGHVVEGGIGVRDPVVVLALPEVRAAGDALEDVGDVGVGEVQEAHQVVRLVVRVLRCRCAGGGRGDEQRTEEVIGIEKHCYCLI